MSEFVGQNSVLFEHYKQFPPKLEVSDISVIEHKDLSKGNKILL